ncbi:hypothetical protein IFT79_13400 [Frigoribacterium sp. CFBP 8759]|uniref:hypothetical protein n=1 Tax=Frigoribacterium sp. CFBP 8759 TaxID=2775283 RepID=UPI001783A451|nr:hypothetical protein [Frigoribacterium sp. CFBP 8759]MBD8486614.1 hypothetical protein [Frigoribacterium sp. CFBP 8759]
MTRIWGQLAGATLQGETGQVSEKTRQRDLFSAAGPGRLKDMGQGADRLEGPGGHQQASQPTTTTTTIVMHLSLARRKRPRKW